MSSIQAQAAQPRAGTVAETFKGAPSSKLPEGFQCTSCGTKHEFGVWVYAHWSEDIVHTCSCGQRHSLLKGHVKALSDDS